ncbi:MAG: HAD family hydrolase [Planctomycetota bacterium]|jgi:putative hydrolase of the HAD superfamily
MKFDAVLLDADGVVQTLRPEFYPALGAMLDDAGRVDEFLADVFAVEGPALIGQSDFRDDLQGVLKRWKVRRPIDEVLRIWEMIAPVPGMEDLAITLRRRGLRCFLASNQQSYRANTMSNRLGYAETFDAEFYSFRIGARKPEAAYFRAILDEVDIEAGRMIFVDDHEPNVDAANELGFVGCHFDCRAHVDPALKLAELLAKLGAPLG